MLCLIGAAREIYMKLSSEKALDLLEQFRGKTRSDYWIDHSLCVGEAAARIATALKIDSDKARALGYIHDIGKGVGDFNEHILNGYEYIKNLGYDEEYAVICLTHSYLNNDVACVAGGSYEDVSERRVQFIRERDYTIYEKVINLCDLMCTSIVVTLDRRLIDIILRAGAFPNTQYHIREAYKLKEYIDKKLGYSVYDLFPEIRDNLDIILSPEWPD